MQNSPYELKHYVCNKEIIDEDDNTCIYYTLFCFGKIVSKEEWRQKYISYETIEPYLKFLYDETSLNDFTKMKEGITWYYIEKLCNDAIPFEKAFALEIKRWA